MKMKAEKILQTVTESFAGQIPEKALEIVKIMISKKSLGWKVADSLEEEFNCSNGLFSAIKDAIKEEKSLANYAPRSASASREDRILCTTNSSGKSVSRRW